MKTIVLGALCFLIAGCGGQSEQASAEGPLSCEWETHAVVTPDGHTGCRLVFAADDQRIRRTGSEECSEWVTCLHVTPEAETVEVSGEGALTVRNYPCNAVELGLTHGDCVF